MTTQRKGHPLSQIRHDLVTHPHASPGYGVRRGPGGPLGLVWGTFREAAS
jgi:hypothetical protein